MPLTYTSSYRGKNTQGISTLYRLGYLLKNRNLQNKELSLLDPQHRNATLELYYLGHIYDSNKSSLQLILQMKQKSTKFSIVRIQRSRLL